MWMLKMFDLSDKYTILTKEGCKWCAKVKELVLDAKYIPCDEYLKDRDSFFEHVDALTGQSYRTFPMVFYGAEFVGGYVETKRRIDNELTFETVYF